MISPAQSGSSGSGGQRIYLLFEFAYGYALVFAPDITSEVDVGHFESAEKYITPTINHPQPLKLKALHLFSSSDDALVEMNAISDCLLENLSRAIDGNSNDRIATSSSWLAHNITRVTKIPVGSGIHFYNVMRALRKNIDKFIELHPGDLENAQVNLAYLYSKQRCTATYVENSMVVPYSLKVAVVPHKFEGIFVAKRKNKGIICTKNPVCREALHCEDLISVEGCINENGTEVEYRVWDLRYSKLAAAITCGVTDMWIVKTQVSRVLYLGDVCGITVFQLSDLVGSDGLVYVVGMRDDIVNMANKRSNVVMFGNPHLYSTYRMVVSMVDVLFADMASSHEWFGGGQRIYLLFEFAYGYALVFAPDITSEVDVGHFESAEKYITPTINHPQPLKLKALHLFSSSDDALVEMNAISESIDGNSNDRIATSSSWLAHNITRVTKIPVGSGIHFYNVMRALRKNIDKFIELHPGDLENAQVNLAYLYSKQRCTATYVENSMVVPYSLKVAVVPHKFEGIFVAKRKNKDIICTKNPVCREALHCEDLISVEETQVSRVLYLGDVCGITVFQLSDLVGSDGLVYVVGMRDDIVNMANKRSNVVMFGNPHLYSTYRMVVSMVDVLFADMASSHE
ncbi:hypothetical protein OROGR_017153 [Orobanche gracilis]